jgi:hypothetical protein
MQSWGAAAGMPQAVNNKGFKLAIKNGATKAYSTGASGKFDYQGTPQQALYPTWLLAMPLRLNVHQGLPQHHGPLTLLAGPQRLEAGWLEGDAALRARLRGCCGCTASGWVGKQPECWQAVLRRSGTCMESLLDVNQCVQRKLGQKCRTLWLLMATPLAFQTHS